MIFLIGLTMKLRINIQMHRHKWVIVKRTAGCQRTYTTTRHGGNQRQDGDP